MHTQKSLTLDIDLIITDCAREHSRPLGLLSGDYFGYQSKVSQSSLSESRGDLHGSTPLNKGVLSCLMN